jgi:hypothetical protein
MNVQSLSDALKLPKGQLTHEGNPINFDFGALLRNAIEYMILNGFKEKFTCQAEIIAYAYDEYSWMPPSDEESDYKIVL